MTHSKHEILSPPLSGLNPELNTPLENHIAHFIDDYLDHNHAAQLLARGLRVLGIGLWPSIDHITFRTPDVEKRAKEFLDLGFAFDQKLGIIEYENWWAKVYRKPGFPALFIDQAFHGSRGKGSLIPEWVETFGDKVLHHIAVRVSDIEQAVFFLEKQGVQFAGGIMGDRGTDLRQIFSKPEVKKGKPFSVLELIERRRGYQGFLPPQAQGLMDSTRLTK